MNVLSVALLAVGLLASAWVVVVYVYRSGWPSTVDGQHVLLFTAAMAALFARSLLLRMFPDLPFAGALGFAIGVAVVALLVQRAYLVTTAPRRAARRDAATRGGR